MPFAINHSTASIWFTPGVKCGSGYLGNLAAVSVPPFAFSGQVYVISTAGTIPGGPAVSAGDVVEFQAGTWVVIVSGVGGFVPAGTFLVAAGFGVGAPLTAASDEGKIAYFDGTTNTPSLITPADGSIASVEGSSGLANTDIKFVLGAGAGAGLWAVHTQILTASTGITINPLTNAISVNQSATLDFDSGGGDVRVASTPVAVNSAINKTYNEQQDLNPWVNRTGVVTGNPSSTSVIPVNDTTDLKVGRPVRINQTTPGTLWGIITSVTTDTSITISGPALNTGESVDELSVGPPSHVAVIPLFVSGQFGDGANDLLQPDMQTYLCWELATGFLVRVLATQNSADGGAAQPKVNAKVGGSLALSQDSNNGIQLSGTPGTWTANAGAGVNQSNYQIDYGDAIEIATTVAGTNGDASDLTMKLVFVLE